MKTLHLCLRAYPRVTRPMPNDIAACRRRPAIVHPVALSSLRSCWPCCLFVIADRHGALRVGLRLPPRAGQRLLSLPYHTPLRSARSVASLPSPLAPPPTLPSGCTAAASRRDRRSPPPKRTCCPLRLLIPPPSLSLAAYGRCA